MAEANAKPEYLYSVSNDNEKLKQTAKDAGLTVKFDREVGAYALNTDGMDKGALAAARKAMADFRGKGAKDAWAADREARLAEKAAVKEEVKGREKTTKERGPKVTKDEGILVYPAISQIDEFRKQVRESGSKSTYYKGREGQPAHYKVVTEKPELFTVYQGEEAQKRFVSEYEAKNLGNSTPEIEEVRGQAAKRKGGAFMAQYADRGFLLSDPERGNANHQKQLDSMRDATTGQILAVVGKTRDLAYALRDKEVGMRAEAAGLTVEQVKAMSFADQKAITGADGKPVMLPYEETQTLLRLQRGLKAIDVELKARGVGQERDEQAKGQEAGKSATPPAQTKVGVEESVDNSLDTMAAFQKRGRGASR